MGSWLISCRWYVFCRLHPLQRVLDRVAMGEKDQGLVRRWLLHPGQDVPVLNPSCSNAGDRAFLHACVHAQAPLGPGIPSDPAGCSRGALNPVPYHLKPSSAAPSPFEDSQLWTVPSGGVSGAGPSTGT